MRISDWSSDVCSSDLAAFIAAAFFTVKAFAAVCGTTFISRLVAKAGFAFKSRLVAVGGAIAAGFATIAGLSATETWLSTAKTATRSEFFTAAATAVGVGWACRFLGFQAFTDFGGYRLAEIGRASCKEGGCHEGESSVGAGVINKKTK